MHTSMRAWLKATSAQGGRPQVHQVHKSLALQLPGHRHPAWPREISDWRTLFARNPHFLILAFVETFGGRQFSL